MNFCYNKKKQKIKDNKKLVIMIIEEFSVHNNIVYQRQKMSRIDVQFFLKLLMITVCCIIGTNCEPLRGIKELKAALHESRLPPPYLGHCDFERPCTSWNYDAGFKIISTNHRKIGLPKTDANKNRLGLLMIIVKK